MSQATSRQAGAHHQGDRPAAGDGEGWPLLRRLGAWLGLPPGERVDCQRGTAIDACAAFRRGDEFLQRWRRDRVTVTVLLFELHDLAELECVFGPGAAREAIEQATARLERIAGKQGSVLRTGPALFTVLLPDTGKEDALDLLRGAFGQSCSLELEADGEDLVLVPEFALRILSTAAVPLLDVHHGLCREIQQGRAREQQRQEYLQRERESHSRPMTLPDAPELLPGHEPRRAPRAEPYPRIPMTMPVPLGRR
ncbi:MAG TPA: hypothetical protein VGE20_05310 [Ramlibacter sp.]